MPSTPTISRLAELAGQHGATIGVAESLTGGLLASRLSSGPDASSWFRGGVVAYHTDVKQSVLAVPPGPVVSANAAMAMARGAADLLDATVTVALTGVGGPGPEEGEPPGTVWMAVAAGRHDTAHRYEFAGEPEEVLEASVAQALAMLTDALESLPREVDLSGRHDGWPGKELGLTERESQVMGLVAKGLPNREIAEQLLLSVDTVKTHLKALYRKMGVRNRAEVVALAHTDRSLRRSAPGLPVGASPRTTC